MVPVIVVDVVDGGNVLFDNLNDLSHINSLGRSSKVGTLFQK